MAKNVYKAGLNNVGSYQVSGKPFVTASTVSDGVEQQIEFPEVTNNITVKLDSAAGGTSDYTMHNSWYLSGSHMVVSGALAFDGSDLDPTSSVSFSWWGKPAPKGFGASKDMSLMGFGNSWNENDNTLTQDKDNANVAWINALGYEHNWADALFPSGYSSFDSDYQSSGSQKNGIDFENTRLSDILSLA